jgi:uncharacterized protein YjbI with pentapeptide repeats
MADNQMVSILLSSPGEWNSWRAGNPGARPDLTKARLSGADLTKALLNEADLIAADLSGAILARASLVGALLLGANLRRSDLTLADLRGADLRGANLCGADLSKAIFLIQTQLESAIGDGGTKLPPGLSRPGHWVGGRA